MTVRGFFILILVVLLVVGGVLGFVWYKSRPAMPALEGAPGTPSFPTATPKSTSTLGAPTLAPGQPVLPPTAPPSPLVGRAGLYQVSLKPVAGGTSWISGKTTTVVFMERATGHVYQDALAGIGPVRLSNTTIPRVHDAFWSKERGNLQVILRYIDKDSTIKVFAASLKNIPTTTSSTSTIEAASEGALVGSFLPETATDFSLSPQGTGFFYLEKSDRGVSGMVTDFAGKKKTTVFTSPFAEWHSQWFSTSTIALVTKPAMGVSGLLYFLDPSTKKLTRILADRPGLVALPSPNGKKILAAESSTAGNIRLFIYSVIKRTDQDLVSKTLPDKCAWAKDSTLLYCGVPSSLPSAAYPDEWYSGEVGFADALWQINSDTGEARVLFSPEVERLGQTLDVFNPFVSDDGRWLFFTAKNTLTLWAFDLRQEF